MSRIHNRASFFRIAASLLYDALILFGLLMGATALLMPFVKAHIPSGTISYQIYLLVVMYLYFEVCWRKGGQTIGMKAWKIRLISNQGPITRRQTLIRFLVGSLSLATLGLGFFAILLPPHLSWHDRLSSTQIVRIQ